MTRLNGKTAVITGGATGIGLAAAKRFIEEGAFVFIFGRRQEALDAAVADLGPNARAVKGSVSDEADLDRLYAAVNAERGTLDVVFANAGVGSQLALGKITAKHIDATFDVNVKGTIFTVQKALPLMGQGGSIILTGSSAGTTGAPGLRQGEGQSHEQSVRGRLDLRHHGPGRSADQHPGIRRHAGLGAGLADGHEPDALAHRHRSRTTGLVGSAKEPWSAVSQAARSSNAQP